MNFYIRKARIVVGDDKEAIEIPARTEIGDLKIEFQIKYALTGEKPKDNFISVYNLSDTTQSFIIKRGQRVRLYAGYTEDPPIIFDGEITTIDNGRWALESITKMTLGDSVYSITNAIFAKSYSGIVSAKTIIKDAAQSFGIPVVGIESLPDSQESNFAYDGASKTLLTQLLAPMGYDWYVETGVLRFSKRGEARPDLEAVLLNENTGMVLSPRLTEKGIRVVSLLNNNLRIGGKIKIQSKTLHNAGDDRRSNQLSYSLDGFYKINELLHHGNNWDDQMVTEILGVKLDG